MDRWARYEDVVKGFWIMEEIEWFENKEFSIACYGKSDALEWVVMAKGVENLGVRPM